MSVPRPIPVVDPPEARAPALRAAGPRSAWLALTLACLTLLSAWVLRLPALDEAQIRAQQAAPAGEVPAPESGHLRRHREGRRGKGRRSAPPTAPPAGAP
ncbi:MAG: hypothetical protein JNM72_26695 [Deltaproteobacteria bacterium]|nr:hypothetical protein [Deltaproteobacteria bacterium]